MRTAADDGTGTDGASTAWRPLATGALLALAAASAAATWIAPLPDALLRQVEVPASSVGWLPAYIDGAPRHWLEDEPRGEPGNVLVDGPVQMAVLLRNEPAGHGSVLVFLPAASAPPAIFINGAHAPPDVQVGAPYLAASRMQPIAIRVPRHFFRPGTNRLDAVFPASAGKVLMAPPLIGSDTVLAPTVAHLSGWLSPLRTFATWACLVAACMALAASVFAARRGWFVGLSASAAAFGCRLLPGGASLPTWLSTDAARADQVLLAAALASLACAVANRPRVTSSRAAGALAATVVMAALVALRQAFEPYSGLWLPWLEAYYGCSLAAAAAVLATASAWTFGKDARRYAAVHLDLRQAVRRQRIEIERANRELELQRRRAAILEERQRVARDVHDGVGGMLASLLARIRMRHVDIGQIETELVDGLADLRLIVDSMDATDGSLATALGVFRARIAPQVEAGGMKLRWEQPDQPPGDAEDPSWMLHLYRLMQEAVNNALRHSGGSNLLVSVRPLDARKVRIEIADDGIGLPVERPARGNGLSNMAWRAQRLGASLRFEPVAVGGGRRGTRVIVEVDMPGEHPADGTAAGVIQPRVGISPS
jgi:signal transduction histidine kinase